MNILFIYDFFVRCFEKFAIIIQGQDQKGGHGTCKSLL